MLIAALDFSSNGTGRFIWVSIWFIQSRFWSDQFTDLLTAVDYDGLIDLVRWFIPASAASYITKFDEYEYVEQLQLLEFFKST